MFLFDSAYFLGLFEDFDTNEDEIYEILNKMNFDDLDEFKHECEKDFIKYYKIYEDTLNMWFEIHS